MVPQWSHWQGSLRGRKGTWGLPLVTFRTIPSCSLRFPSQVDSAQDRVVKREDGEKLAKVGEVSVCWGHVSPPTRP